MTNSQLAVVKKLIEALDKVKASYEQPYDPHVTMPHPSQVRYMDECEKIEREAHEAVDQALTAAKAEFPEKDGGHDGQ